MAKKVAAKTNVNLAPKIVKKALVTLSGLLLLVGKPLFRLLSLVLIVLITVSFYTGVVSRTLLKKAFVFLASAYKEAKRRKRVKRPKV